MESSMLLRSLTLMSLALVAAPAFGQSPEPTEVDGKIDWVFNYEDGQALSKKTSKPMFVVFRCER